MAESSNKSHFMNLTVRRLYYSSIRLDYFFLLEIYYFHILVVSVCEEYIHFIG